MSSSEDEIVDQVEYLKTDNKTITPSNEKIYRTKFRHRFHVKKIQARKSRSTLEKYTSGVETLKRLTQCIQKEDETIRSDFKLYEIKAKTNNQNNQSKLVNEFDFFTTEEQMEKDNKTIGSDILIEFRPQSLNYTVELSETKHYWKKSRSVAPVFVKTGTNGPRFLSEDGMYVETLPSMTKSQRNTIERRLLIVENDKKWLNCEGNLEIIKAPTEYALMRPYIINPNGEMKNFSQYVTAQLDMPQFEEVRIDEENVVHIYIHYLKFQHHPLFSAQHVLQNRLIYYYELFKREEDENKIERITKRLHYLRNTKTNLENYLVDAGNDEYDNILQKMYETLKEIHKLRGKLLDERLKQRKTIKTVLETWKMLKHVRQIDGYISIPLKLIIKKENQSYAQDKRNIDNEMKLLFYEIKYENDFLKRNRNTFVIREPNEFDTTKEECFSLNKVRNKYEKCFREPGEPIVDFFIEYDQEMVTKVVEDKNEKLRRNVVRATRTFFKLLHKGIEICKSKTIEMDDNFFCEFDEKFVIKTENISESITVQIFEQAGNNISKKKLYETNLTLPRLSTCKMMNISFEIKKQVPQRYAAVGTGESVKKLFLEKYNLILDDSKLSAFAIMSYGVEWTIKENAFYNSNTDNDMEILLRIANDVLSLSNDKDPQDPKYSKFDNLLTGNRDKETYSNSEEDTKRFNYNFHLRSFKFCKNEEIRTNERLTMLQLRNKNVPRFYGQCVPINEKEISKHLMTDYNMSRNEKELYKSLIQNDNVTKTEGFAILREIYYQVFQKCRNTNIILSHEDIVNEQLIQQFENYIKQTVNCTFNWLSLNSCVNLMPYEKIGTQKKSTKNETFFEVRTPLKIFVTIRSALNVPKRTRKHVNVHRDKDEHVETESGDFYLSLCVILKHSNGKTVESGIVKSSNPIWNETLILEIEASNVDFMSPNFLSGSISLQLFDILSDEEKVWLGSTEINISSIYESNTLEGVFRLETPTLLFGYEPENNTNIYTHFTPVSLSLSITAHPFMPRLHIDVEKLQSNETPYLRNYILKWNERYNENFPCRKFSALTIDVYGRTNCVTRYISPIEPPQLNRDTFQVTAQQLAKYFSKFPFSDYNKFYQNIWLSPKLFLNFMIGSVVDHAVTLTCCLQSLNLQVWLLLGYGIPNGSSAYVLTKESAPNFNTPTYYIFDVTTGTKYSILEKICPLQRIYCVVNGKNVWANTQRTDKIENTRFDFNKTSDWLPLFTNDIVGPSLPIQQRVTYKTVSNEHYLLQNKLEKKIHKKIAKLKKMQTIKFNNALSKAFKKVMSSLLDGCFSDQLDYDLAQNITSIQLSHNRKMKGFLICKTYNSVNSLFEFIENTDLLKPQRNDSEYILATQLILWPNQIVMLWILIALVH